MTLMTWGNGVYGFTFGGHTQLFKSAEGVGFDIFYYSLTMASI